MNAGIADAAGLAWLLAAHLNGWAPEEILDAYDAERRPITDQVSRLAMSHAQAQIANRAAIPDDLEGPGPEGEAARAAYGAAMVELNTAQYCCEGLNFGSYLEGSPLIPTVAESESESPPPYTMGTATPSTVPGCRLPHIWLRDGSSLYDRLAPDYTLLRFDPATTPSDTGPLVDAASRSRTRLAVLDLSAETAVPGQRHRYLLVRPDQHIAWRGDALPRTADAARALVDQLRGAGPTAR